MNRRDELVRALRLLASASLLGHDGSSKDALAAAERVALEHLRSGHSFDDAFQAGRRALYDGLHPLPVQRRLRPMTRSTSERTTAWSEEAASTDSPATTA